MQEINAGEYSDFAEVICKVCGEKIPRSMFYDHELKVFVYDDCFQMELYQVTHWMPLPDPLKGE